MSQSTETVKLSELVMWPVQPSCSAGGKIAPGVFILPQGKTGVYILPHKIIASCEIIFFVKWPEENMHNNTFQL